MATSKSEDVTLRDIAKKADVSVSTVSKILRNKDNFSQSTRRRVIEAAKELNYPFQPLDKKSIIALVTYGRPGVDDLFAHQVLHGISNGAQDLNLELNLVFCDGMQQVSMDYINSLNSSGALLVGTAISQRRYYTNLLADSSIPYVGISKCGCDSSSIVGADYVSTAEELVRYLVECGHRRIAFIGWAKGSLAVSDDRFCGYRQGLFQADIAFEKRLFWTRGRSVEMTNILSSPDRPTAVITHDDNLAAYMIKEAAKNGLRVPEDLSIVSADDKGVAEHLSPPVTAMKHDYYLIGYVAVEELSYQMQDRDYRKGLTVYLPSKLQIRESVVRI
jgi:LacI family transcriptional regulator